LAHPTLAAEQLAQMCGDALDARRCAIAASDTLIVSGTELTLVAVTGVVGNLSTLLPRRLYSALRMPVGNIDNHELTALVRVISRLHWPSASKWVFFYTNTHIPAV
jgi:hypothetical protein